MLLNFQCLFYLFSWSLFPIGFCVHLSVPVKRSLICFDLNIIFIQSSGVHCNRDASKESVPEIVLWGQIQEKMKRIRFDAVDQNSWFLCPCCCNASGLCYQGMRLFTEYEGA